MDEKEEEPKWCLWKYTEATDNGHLVYCMNTAISLINDLREMSEDSTKVNTTHKEETKSRIEKDMADRLSLSETLRGCKDPPGPDTHPNGQLIILCTGHIATEHINIWDAVAIGTKQIRV